MTTEVGKNDHLSSGMTDSPPKTTKEEKKIWKIIVSWHNASHQEVHRIEFPEQELTGEETIGEIVFPTLREALLSMEWKGYGLFAQHEPIYNSTELNDLNYQRSADGTLTLDCEDHNCQWRAVKVPLIKDSECIICYNELGKDQQVFPPCFHSCICKNCYPNVQRCPKCRKRWHVRK